MAAIESVELSKNSIPVDGENFALNGVNLYSFAGCDGLTLGQLVTAVCVHAGVAIEDQTVNKMNIITLNSRRLRAESKVVTEIISGKANYDSVLDIDGFEGMTFRAFLTNVLGMEIGGDGTLPENLSSYDEKMRLFTALKEKINADATASQQDMIDLQTYESRRDVAYATATNIVKNIGMSKQMVVSNTK